MEAATPKWESGLHHYDSFWDQWKVHMATDRHKKNWSKKVHHYAVHMGWIAGGTARFYTMSMCYGIPIQVPGLVIPQCTNQGATYPCKEDVVRNLGSMVDLTGATAAQLARDNIEVVVNVTQDGQRTDQSYRGRNNQCH